MTHSFRFSIVRILLGILLVFSLVSVQACEDTRAAETNLFEEAEEEYRRGNYPDALTGYQAFLTRYPNSPLASTAEQRLRTIHREVSSVMGADDAYRPSYHGFHDEQSAPDVLPGPPPTAPDHQ